MEKQSKRYAAPVEVADLAKDYPLTEAVDILAKFPKAKFDETVELSVRLGVDPTAGDQMIRGTTPLPNGSGKKVRVLVFTDNVKAAIDAGADHAGLQDIMAKINEGWLDFDVAIATTEAMKTVRTIARVLGPKGLMPNPKSGTVTDDIAAGIKAVKAGRVEFKMDKTCNIGVGIGKRSFTAAQILENAQAVLEAVGKAKPASFKGHYIKNVAISSSQSPAVRIASAEYSANTNRRPMRAEKKYLIDEVETHLKKSDYVILANFTGDDRGRCRGPAREARRREGRVPRRQEQLAARRGEVPRACPTSRRAHRPDRDRRRRQELRRASPRSSSSSSRTSRRSRSRPASSARSSSPRRTSSASPTCRPSTSCAPSSSAS